MGHDSENLLGETGLGAFGGMIVSPVNYPEARVAAQIAAIRGAGRKQPFDVIFDPQLYSPRTERGCLREWSYFPSDVDTAGDFAHYQRVTKNAVDGVPGSDNLPR